LHNSAGDDSIRELERKPMPKKPVSLEPVISILDQRFKYTPSTQTDLAKKFRAIKREMKRKAEEQAQLAPQKIKPFRRAG
jgi:hypothetical protein